LEQDDRGLLLKKKNRKEEKSHAVYKVLSKRTKKNPERYNSM
jgi:hypothetical protein